MKARGGYLHLGKASQTLLCSSEGVRRKLDESLKAGDLIRSLLYLSPLLQRGSDTNWLGYLPLSTYPRSLTGPMDHLTRQNSRKRGPKVFCPSWIGTCGSLGAWVFCYLGANTGERDSLSIHLHMSSWHWLLNSCVIVWKETHTRKRGPRNKECNTVLPQALIPGWGRLNYSDNGEPILSRS